MGKFLNHFNHYIITNRSINYFQIKWLNFDQLRNGELIVKGYRIFPMEFSLRNALISEVIVYRKVPR